MSRLYLRFYFALLGSLFVFAVGTALLWHRIGGPEDRVGEKFGGLLESILAPADAPVEQQQAALQRLATGLRANLTLVAKDGTRIAAAGEPPPPRDAGWRHPWKEEQIWEIRLPDGRGLQASVRVGFIHTVHAVLMTLMLLALAVGVGAFPIVRRLTQRLERLEAGVESLGAGDLSARVAIEGKDEVARLAASFNRAAGRIEQLVGAHKALLANASHELRTPLARIRLAVELMGEAADAKRKAGLDRDIAELDLLIDEILLASRLDAVKELDVDEEVDLLALAAEECARYDDAHLDGVPVQVRGDPRLLRRLLRNLLENAHRHGAPPIQVRLTKTSNGAELVVDDAGPALAQDQRERLFEPFYRRAQRGENMGAGLGLSLVRQIARRHGGDAHCTSTPDGRSSFVVRL